MTGLVLDASVTVNAFDAVAPAPLSERALEAAAGGDGVAPLIWWAELRTAFLMKERRGQATSDDIAGVLAMIDALSVAMDAAPRSASVMGLARRHGLSVYDALYLELALRRALPLATLDKRLAAAARAEGCFWAPDG